MSERKQILWLVSWYPNKYRPFDGDFVQRHARATALYHDIHVLFLCPAAKQADVEESVSTSDGLTEQIVYLPKMPGLPGKAKALYLWQRMGRQKLEEIVRGKRLALVHVHVPWKAGLLAIWLQRKFTLPYVVTEHWGIYNNIVDDNVHQRSLLFRRLLKQIFLEATALVFVSKFLGDGIRNTILKKPFSVVPNAVDTALFFPHPTSHKPFTFLHVSNMVPLKNVDGILQAFQHFGQQHGEVAQLVMVGNSDDHYKRLARSMGLLNRSVFFRGEVPYEQVANEMRSSHVLIINSHIENSPCVIGEALCCGLPVIATEVGGIPELLPAQAGILIPPNDVAALVSAMSQIMTDFSLYNRDTIAAGAKKRFSYPVVGGAFSNLYLKLLAEDSK